MDLTLYRPSDLELWISKVYQENGINYASDIDIERIADIFNIDIRDTRKNPYVYFNDDGSDALIFLNSYFNEEQRRESFFHELCHPLQHVGCQNELPPLFKELQEIQAGNFQLYAAMPSYMLKEFWDVSPAVMVKILSEEFRVSERFVIRRLEQIQARIRGVEWMLSVPKRQKPLHPDIAVEKGHVLEVIFELRRIQQHRRLKGKGQAHG